MAPNVPLCVYKLGSQKQEILPKHNTGVNAECPNCLECI